MHKVSKAYQLLKTRQVDTRLQPSNTTMETFLQKTLMYFYSKQTECCHDLCNVQLVSSKTIRLQPAQLQTCQSSWKKPEDQNSVSRDGSHLALTVSQLSCSSRAGETEALSALCQTIWEWKEDAMARCPLQEKEVANSAKATELNICQSFQ